MTGFNQKVQPVTIVSCKKRSFSTFQEAAFHIHPCCSSSTENNTETLYCCLMSPSCITNIAEVHYWCPEWGTWLHDSPWKWPGERTGATAAREHWQFVLRESSWLSLQHVDRTHRLQGTLPDMSQLFPKVQLYDKEQENSFLGDLLFRLKTLFL